MNIINSDNYFKNIVILTGQRSPIRLQIGCLLVKNNQIISHGYNEFLPGLPNNIDQAINHAEQNVLCDCAKRGISCDGATAYITHYPCIICTRLLLAAGIKEIKYINDNNNNPLVKLFCEQAHVLRIQI